MTNVDTYPQVGKDASLYYNSASHATPTWVEVTGAQDVSVPLTKGTADIMSRANSWKFKGAGLKEGAIEFGYLHQRGADTVFDALLASFVSDTPIQMAAMDDTITLVGAQGLRAFMVCTQMTQGQAMEEGMRYDFRFEPIYYDEAGSQVAPDWYEVS